MNRTKTNILFLRNTLAIVLTVLCCISYAQTIRFHNRAIKDLAIDSLGSVIIQDVDNDYWSYHDLQFTKLDWKEQNLKMMKGVSHPPIFYNKKDIYSLHNGQLKKIATLDDSIIAIYPEGSILHVLSSDVYYKLINGEEYQCDNSLSYKEEQIDFYSINDTSTMLISKKGIQYLCNNADTIVGLSSDINASTRVDSDNFILATDRDLWSYRKGSEIKRYYVPGIALPDSIKKLHVVESKLWILTQASVLYVYDFDTQILGYVDNDVVSFDLDRWQTVYLNKGKYIETVSKYSNDELPIFSVSTIKNGYRDLELDSIQVYDTDENDFYLRLQSHYSPSPLTVRYQYRLHESDPWIYLEESELFLIDLPSGKYNLQLRATADGQYFTDIQSVEFVIRSPFRNSVWFYVLVFLSLLTALCILSLLRGIRERRQLNADKASIQKELSLIRSEQKLNQAQLNPHFLFNALNSIAGMIAMNDNKLARRSLNKFAQLMRMALDNSSVESISINDEVRFLNNYLSLEQMLRNDSFDYEIDTNNIDTTLPPMLIQPLVENAVIHGVAPLKDRRGKIDVVFSQEGQYLIVEVIDNGIGIDASLKKSGENHVSKALAIIENRLKAIDRWGKMDKYLVPKNLSESNTLVSGTVFKLMIAKKRI